MIDGKEYAKQMRENAVIDDDIVKVSKELWCQIADVIEEQQAEIERLKKYNTDVAHKHCDDGIKEFAQRVKMAFYYEFEELIPSIMADIIDNLVKEMEADNG